MVEGTAFTGMLGGREVAVTGSTAGIVVERSAREWILAVPAGRLDLGLR